jgi:hypothetical protein
MKDMIERARRLSRTVAVGIRRAVDPPLDAEATPLDLGLAVLEAIERRVQPAGGGRRVLPDSYVRVKALAADAAEERALRTVLDGLREAALARLRELKCDAPHGFRVDVLFLRARPGTWEPSQRLAVDFPAQPRTAPEAPPVEPGPPPLKVTVTAGTATKSAYSFTERVVRIGRSETPVDSLGRVRRNDVAFLESDDERNKTVTRGHAELRYDRERGEFRLFDEGSANGTRILRNGEVIEVSSRDPIGVALKPGDELQFGTAAVRVNFVPPPVR